MTHDQELEAFEKCWDSMLYPQNRSDIKVLAYEIWQAAKREPVSQEAMAKDSMLFDLVGEAVKGLKSLASGGPYPSSEYVRVIKRIASRLENFIDEKRTSTITPELRAEAEQLIQQAVTTVAPINEAMKASLQIDGTIFKSS